MNTKNNNSSITVSLRQSCTIISQYSAEYCFPGQRSFSLITALTSVTSHSYIMQWWQSCQWP